ncbi:MAG: type restriction enzyme protein [Acidobacteriota bacterium]|nr:type restriction enzyme protein [Acidobacteriota bacterium]
MLFFDKKPVAKAPPTKEIWVYDLRSNRNFSLRQNPIKPKDLTDFINCYRAEAPSRREETDHFRRFTYSEIVARDKVSLDIQLQHDTMKVSQRVPPQALMKEILNDLEEAMKQFAVAEREIRR